MERDERRRADVLDRYWDATQRGRTGRRLAGIDGVTAAIVDHLGNSAAPPAMNAARLRVRQRIAVASSSTEETMPASSSSALVPGGVLRPLTIQDRSVARRRHHLVARLALAALLVLALGAGYARFGPLGADDGPPANIPAVALTTPVATPEAASPTAATPAVALVPTVGHSMVGIWQWDYQPCDPGINIGIAIFNADGSFLESEDGWGIDIGEWRATGDRSVELVTILHRWPNLEPMFGVAENVPMPEQETGRIELIGSVSIELSSDGSSFVARGFYEPRRANGDVITHLELADDCNFEVLGTRLVTLPVATPTP